MASCPSMKITISSLHSTRNGCIFQEHYSRGSLQRSSSAEALYSVKTRTAFIRKSASESNLHCCCCHIRADSSIPKKKQTSSTVGVFPVELTSSSVLPTPVQSIFFDTNIDTELKELKELANDDQIDEYEQENAKVIKRVNWLERLMELRQLWSQRRQKKNPTDDSDEEADNGMMTDEDGGCSVNYEDEEEFDSQSFSRLLVPVQWSDTKRLSQLAFLCHKAYSIPDIKRRDLKRYYGLNFTTSSLEKKAAEAAKVEELTTNDSPPSSSFEVEMTKRVDGKERSCLSHPSLAYQIAASQMHHSSQQQQPEKDATALHNNRSKRAAYVAASTMTALVGAREKEKQDAARDLQSTHSSPCEWFVCDDQTSRTRYFVIQGSSSLASWQANLFFEPTKFEGTEALVHRGIYEAAKGIYKQLMPEIQQHMDAYGDEATFQFTGHSLGGSLSLLVHLMLITRGIVDRSSLLPVVTFGSPFIFCNGQKLTNELALDTDSQVHNIMMHRDIVPRAFSCNYPHQVGQILKRVNGTFRSHPCLNKHKFLYAPLGKLFILQPDEKVSPRHPLLPQGSALYTFDKAQSDSPDSALRAFINTPHPLETMSDPKAYGSDGTIIRDHDSSNYLKAVNGVLRRHTRMVFRKVRRQRKQVWPLITLPSDHAYSHPQQSTLRSAPTSTKEIMTGAEI